MSDAVEQDEDQLLGTSALRGILLLGGVAVVSFFAWKYWNKIKKSEAATPHRPLAIRVPIELPIQQPKKK